MRYLFAIIFNIILIFPEAWAWQWISNLIMNSYGQHGLGYSTCIAISVAVGAIVFVYQLGNEISKELKK